MISVFRNLYIYFTCCVPNESKSTESASESSHSSKSSLESIKDKIVIILNLRKS